MTVPRRRGYSVCLRMNDDLQLGLAVVQSVVVGNTAGETVKTTSELVMISIGDDTADFGGRIFAPRGVELCYVEKLLIPVVLLVTPSYISIRAIPQRTGADQAHNSVLRT